VRSSAERVLTPGRVPAHGMLRQMSKQPASGSAPVRGLTRAEAKARTRAQLLEGALRILDEEGETGLTTTAVTRHAGISQPSFYAHFSDMDDLLHSLIDELAQQRLRHVREARQAAWETPGDLERVRDIFRIPLAYSVEHPRLFRLLLKSRHDRSPLGDWSRSVNRSQRQALAEDLLAVARPNPRESDRRRIEMIAEGVVSLTETMILGHLEGRYPDVEEIVDVLVAFSSGYSSLLGGPAAEVAAQRARLHRSE
jgi:AcrR family transcriptional regulator